MSISMREITEEDYEEFLKKHKEVVFEDNVSGKRVVIKLEGRKFIPESELYPKDFELEGTTVWSFPQRGTRATHKGEHKYYGHAFRWCA